MNELRRVRERRHVLGATLDEVLDRLDVVIGFGFDRLDLGAVLDAEVGDQLAQPSLGIARRRGNSGRPSIERFTSHSTSTRSRSRMNAYSEKTSRSSAVCRP